MIVDGSMVCERYSRAVAEVEGGQRLITPKVVELTSAHYGCETHPTINEFGPILQTQVTTAYRVHSQTKKM